MPWMGRALMLKLPGHGRYEFLPITKRQDYSKEEIGR
jgi:hypothetical protein